jgi:hypothetical protein
MQRLLWNVGARCTGEKAADAAIRWLCRSGLLEDTGEVKKPKRRPTRAAAREKFQRGEDLVPGEGGRDSQPSPPAFVLVAHLPRRPPQRGAARVHINAGRLRAAPGGSARPSVSVRMGHSSRAHFTSPWTTRSPPRQRAVCVQARRPSMSVDAEGVPN